MSEHARSTRSTSSDPDVVTTDTPLSRDAAEVLTDELREATGRDDVRVAAGRSAPSAARKEKAPPLAALYEARVALGLGFFFLLTVGAIVTFATGSWWALALAIAVHGIGTLAVAAGALSLTSRVEHVAPGAAAALAEEGVADPDAVLTELVDDLGETSPDRGRETSRGTEGSARDAADQRTANTPAHGSHPTGAGTSVVGAMPWAVVVAMLVASVVGAAVIGGAAWVLPPIMLVLVAGWLAVQLGLLRSGRGVDAGAGESR